MTSMTALGSGLPKKKRTVPLALGSPSTSRVHHPARPSVEVNAQKTRASGAAIPTRCRMSFIPDVL
jgi:hypothetical protein